MGSIIKVVELSTGLVLIELPAADFPAWFAASGRIMRGVLPGGVFLVD